MVSLSNSSPTLANSLKLLTHGLTVKMYVNPLPRYPILSPYSRPALIILSIVLSDNIPLITSFHL